MARTSRDHQRDALYDRLETLREFHDDQARFVRDVMHLIDDANMPIDVGLVNALEARLRDFARGRRRDPETGYVTVERAIGKRGRASAR